MNEYFKIKVGIEEFSVNKEDVPRIIEAMKTGNIVKLDCGLFRGTAINAVCVDERMRFIGSSSPTPEQIEEKQKLEAEKKQIEKQMSECTLCGHTGWVRINRIRKNGSPDPIVASCECIKLK